MADNVTFSYKTDDVGAGVQVPLVKLDVGADGASSLVTGAVGVPIIGTIADDAADSTPPVKVGGVARTANRTAVATGDRVDSTFDDLGRQVMVLNNVRDLVVQATTTIANTTETTILAAAASTFHDLTSLTITNATATAVTCTLRDVAAGSAVAIFDLAASGGITIPFPVPFKQTTVNTAWTLQLSAGSITVHVLVQAVKNV